MQTSQPANRKEFFRHATARQRLIWGAFGLVVAVIFGGLWLAQRAGVDVGSLFNPCGFKQNYGLPCPTCGMTAAVLAFSRGRLWEAFYVQPAAAVLCLVLVVAAFLALLTAVVGVYSRGFGRVLAQLRIRDVILALLVIIAAGWAVTLARAVAAGA